MNNPMAAMPAAPARATAHARSTRHPADGQNRNRAAHGTRGQLVDGVRRLRAGSFDGVEKQRAEDQIVDVAARATRCGFFGAVHRAADERTGRKDRPDGARVDRIRAQVHTVRSGSQRDIGSIVHEDLRVGAANGVHTARARARQRTRIEVPFTNLNQVDAGARGGSNELDQAIAAGSRSRRGDKRRRSVTRQIMTA